MNDGLCSLDNFEARGRAFQQPIQGRVRVDSGCILDASSVGVVERRGGLTRFPLSSPLTRMLDRGVAARRARRSGKGTFGHFAFAWNKGGREQAESSDDVAI